MYMSCTSFARFILRPLMGLDALADNILHFHFSRAFMIYKMSLILKEKPVKSQNTVFGLLLHSLSFSFAL